MDSAVPAAVQAGAAACGKRLSSACVVSGNWDLSVHCMPCQRCSDMLAACPWSTGCTQTGMDGTRPHPNGCKLVQHAVLGRKVLVVAKDSLTSWTAPFPRPSSAYWHSRGYGHPVPRQFQRHEAAADLKNWWTSDEPGARSPLAHFTSA